MRRTGCGASSRRISFLQMVRASGGVEAAKSLLRSGPNTSYGFEVLWEKKQLGRSVEAQVLGPEYEALFTDDEREIARRRLELHEFDVDAYLREVSRPR